MCEETVVDMSVNPRYWKMLLALGALLFGIAYTQAPLYYSNQHQYFLHGLATGGEGYLKHDWLANTLDPTPVFTAFAAFTYRHLDVMLFYAVFLGLQAVYFISLMAIAARLIPEDPSRCFKLYLCAAILIVLHAGVLRWASVKWLGTDYPWYFQCGVAGQYVLGPGLQPSAFGVFLIASIAAFFNGRVTLAVLLSSIACCLHATYILPTAYITLGMMLALQREGYKRAIWVGMASLVLVLPCVAYTATTFGPSSPEVFDEAERIVVDFRIPHHALIHRWFDKVAAFQVLWVLLAIATLWWTKLFPVVAVPAGLGIALTLLQLATESRTLALFFPWRISAVLVPIATTVMVVRVAGLLPHWPHIGCLAAAGVIAAVVCGIVVEIKGTSYRNDDRELPALEYIRDHKQRGDLYLIPARIPDPNSGPTGVISTSFTPPPGAADKHLVSVDLQRFRIFTGVPIYVDFKSIPYKDYDVLEWYNRLQFVVKVYADESWSTSKTRRDLQSRGITHVLIPSSKQPLGEGYELLYGGDDIFR